MFHLARHRVGRRGIAVDVERRRIIAVDKNAGVAGLRVASRRLMVR